ncbi:MAG: phosphoadenosine phosphosulfate reductase [Robiginitomaculum sp.]|nr:MAG: phosphoadenosine phosphosulfate reductase [Robiginitomaculum sp.]
MFAPKLRKLVIPPHIEELVQRGALFAVSHSAGKDSQAMLLALRAYKIPDAQIILIHADLGEVEWEGNIDHIQNYGFGYPLIIAKARRGLLQMIEERGMFPSPSIRQCTSDLKRGPIERELRRFLKRNPQYNKLLVNCMGFRAQESSARAKRNPFTFNQKNSKAGREWFDWLPIHAWSEQEVFGYIAQMGQKPHWAYAKGMSRLSCCFCIMASVSDLTISARENPKLYAIYVKLEKKINHTLSMSRKGLEEITGIKINQ